MTKKIIRRYCIDCGAFLTSEQQKLRCGKCGRRLSDQKRKEYVRRLWWHKRAHPENKEKPVSNASYEETKKTTADNDYVKLKKTLTYLTSKCWILEQKLAAEKIKYEKIKRRWLWLHYNKETREGEDMVELNSKEISFIADFLRHPPCARCTEEFSGNEKQTNKALSKALKIANKLVPIKPA